jgi:hypothetical protein
MLQQNRIVSSALESSGIFLPLSAAPLERAAKRNSQCASQYRAGKFTGRDTVFGSLLTLLI